MMYYVVNILKLIFAAFLTWFFFISSFNCVGAVNAFTNPEKHKKVEIKNKTIKKLIPYKPKHFIFLELPDKSYYERIIYKRTCVLAIIVYILTFIMVVSFLIMCLAFFIWGEQNFLYKLLPAVNIVFFVVWAFFFAGYESIVKYKHRKKWKKEGMNFKL